jgi:hypothetical protein
VNARDAAVAHVARILDEPTARCPRPECGRLLRLVCGGTILPTHRRPEPGHSLCPASETTAVTE